MSDRFIRHDGSDNGDMFICVACRTGSMHRNILPSHLDGAAHRESLRLECVKGKAKSLTHKIDAYLEHSPWKQRIKAELFDFMFTDGHVAPSLSDPLDPLPPQITQKLDTYIKLEKTSLLELAVWKASCLWFDGSMTFYSMQDILDQWAMDEAFDPVAYKSRRRFTGNVAVIMRGVLEYL